MTAASGVVHEEFHSPRFTEAGGTLEMIQLWVNLPASKKMSSPGYQLLKAESFPNVELGSANARLVAGALRGANGAARTYPPITIFDLEFSENGEIEFALDQGTTTLLVMLRGDAQVQSGQKLDTGQLVVFDRNTRGAIRLAASEGAASTGIKRAASQ